MRPRLVAAAFVACLLLALLAMGWTTTAVLRVERAERSARGQAALEENTRLALWRMDSAVSPLLAQESARSYAEYARLRATDPRVVLYFEIDPQGGVHAWPPAAAAGRLAQVRAFAATPALVAARATSSRPATPAPPPPPLAKAFPAQKMKSEREYQMRQQASQMANMVVVLPPPIAPVPAPAPEIELDAMAPVWAGEALLLVRRVRVDGVVRVQGCWVDWPRVSTELLASIADLLPRARLERAEPTGPDEERRLATLPVRLMPGDDAAPVEEPGLSPLRLALVGAWASLLVAALSVGALLQGVTALSERRRVFVSAVTHELRTPLTTFRLYTDMLAEGMVSGEEKKREYLERLRVEAQRLGHLVENVLFYARVESGRAGVVRELLALAAFLREDPLHLKERAARAGLELQVATAGAEDVVCRVDRSAVEQVLVNLVDNACRYASASQPPVLKVELTHDARVARVRVRDHGPGLSPVDRRRLFRPFSKSDREAAATAPGVGLGLALSRRLARAQGGDLRVDDSVRDGAAFVLSLPLAD